VVSPHLTSSLLKTTPRSNPPDAADGIDKQVVGKDKEKQVANKTLEGSLYHLPGNLFILFMATPANIRAAC
jgi:hypothetical protein